MLVPRRIISSFSQLAKKRVCSHSKISAPRSRNLNVTLFQCDRRLCSSKSGEKDVPGPLSSKFESFDESTAPIILDVAEERQKIEDAEEVEYDEFAGINLERGTTGVFEINEVVDILRREKGEDICVIKIPEEYCYADYMVIVTSRSSRHMLAMMTFLRKIYKQKMIKSDALSNVEGKTSNKWMAFDMGNIIVHAFLSKERQIYDLESLWSLGQEYDLLSQKDSEVDTISNYTQLISALSPQTSAAAQE